MKSVITSAAFCLFATSASALDTQDIVGTWRLGAATRLLVDTNEIVDAYGGPRPNGWLTYDKDGRMTVICAFQGRTKPVANDKMTDEDRVHLHKTFFAYAGTYKLDGKQISHNIDTSWNEVWSGTSQVREVEYKDGKLVIKTPPFRFNVDGKMSVITLVWEKHP
ncbi:MAG: lipocalin-like domain-containing protein [Methylobacterium sp.]|uniref:lipocalin-like domain-containing protein n=1 Tax=Methylobacterium sp. TaxID=409 RepID=UPI0025D425F5|nr:lipocalin-like domain-containing protein [Methylobacterium sp.]MBX9931513.1 lipocalin-like domain-containing protein [Methylobacterium sp.]